MKQYPTIGREIHFGTPAYVFDKLDGSNIRAEWSRKKYFYKFGSRNRLLGTDQEFILEAENLIRAGFEKEVSDICRKKRYENAVLFFEFWGHGSFAGNHIKETHFTNLIDVSPYKKGILHPRDYLKIFGHLNIAEFLYHGNINHPLVESIKDGSFICSGEGVVCKGSPLKNGYPPLMFKIKTDAWINRLKNYCHGDEKLFKELL